MLKKILLALLVILAVLAVVVAMQPNEFRVERSATIAASDSLVFSLVNDFHEWEAWSPWAKLDPSMDVTYEGPSEGVGASQSWSGNSDVGKGKMTITESVRYDLIKVRLEFIEPFASTNTTEFTFDGQGDQTTVTWSMYGENNFVSKAFGLFMDMDAMIGADFEKGLAAMKATAEVR